MIRQIAWVAWLTCFASLAPSRALGQTAPPPVSPTALSGYMEFHFNKRQFEDGVLDFHRFVLLVTHAFSERLRFVSEVEIEHAFVEGLEEAGELEIEQAYLDFLIRRSFNVRAGVLLVPVGILNERHEPPVFYGVERPLVDTVLVPTTWFEGGAGIHGEVGRGLRYRAYVMAPLDASAFSAEEGLRGGRQKAAEANIGRPALTGRAEWVGTRGLTIGASAWSGRSGGRFRPRFDVPVHLVEVDGRYARGRIEARAQFVQVSVANVDQLNRTLTLSAGVDPNIAERMRGGYVEAGARLFSSPRSGEFGVFARFESVNTQARMAPGATALPEFDRDQFVVGATYWPEPDVAVKADYTWARSRSTLRTAPNAFSVGLGWWF